MRNHPPAPKTCKQAQRTHHHQSVGKTVRITRGSETLSNITHTHLPKYSDLGNRCGETRDQKMKEHQNKSIPPTPPEKEKRKEKPRPKMMADNFTFLQAAQCVLPVSNCGQVPRDELKCWNCAPSTTTTHELQDALGIIMTTIQSASQQHETMVVVFLGLMGYRAV